MKVVAFDVLISVKKQIGIPTGLSSCNLNRSVRIQSISLPSGRADIESKESKRFAQPDPKCGAEDAVSYSPDLAADVANRQDQWQRHACACAGHVPRCLAVWCLSY